MRSATLLASLLVVAAGCGGGDGSDTTTGPPNTPPTTPNTVNVGNNFFSPVDISVASGTTVTWQWVAGATDHNVTFDDNTHSETQSSGTFARVFTAPGTYAYHCTIHGAAVMHGSVIVSATGGGTGGGSGRWRRRRRRRVRLLSPLNHGQATCRRSRTTACSSGLSAEAAPPLGGPPFCSAS